MEEAGVSDLMAFLTRRSCRGTWMVNKRRAGTASAMFVLFLPSCYRFEGTRSIPTIFDSIRDECLCLGFPSRPLGSFRIGEDNEQPFFFFLTYGYASLHRWGRTHATYPFRNGNKKQRKVPLPIWYNGSEKRAHRFMDHLRLSCINKGSHQLFVQLWLGGGEASV